MQKRLRDVFFRSSALTVISAYLFFFSEWAFHITKSSFLTSLSIWDGLAALFMAALPVALAAQVVLLAACLLALMLGKGEPGEKQIYLVYLAPVAILAATLFLLIENFTYTLFGFNAGSFGGTGRLPYAVLLAVLLAALLKYFESREQALRGAAGTKTVGYAAGLLVAISVLSFAVKAAMYDEAGADAMANKSGNWPNILILSVDGVNAAHMSAYGSERRTTPVLEELKKESLYAENSFTNCAKSGCSIASLLTGKLPLNTRLIFPPDILTGKNVYEHLPGLLRRAGYKSTDISIRYYADAYDLNIRRGFDSANGQTESAGSFAGHGLPRAEKIFGDGDYFLRRSYERFEERLLHVFGIREMDNPYLRLTTMRISGSPAWDGDDPDRLKQLLGFMDMNRDRFFAHVHFLDTHGPRFVVRNKVFSNGREQDRDWMADFYDDAIIDFDENVGKVISHLKEAGLYDKTIIVITSDHGTRWSTDVRLPLMIRFPNAEFRGVVEDNVQRLDIAPTLLKYIGLGVPEWMEGRPLIGEPLDKYYPVFSAMPANARQLSNGNWMTEDNPPPFYSLGGVAMIVCDKWYGFSLNNGGKMTVNAVKGHTQQCDEDSLPDTQQAKKRILAKLKQSGYRVEDAGFRLQ